MPIRIPIAREAARVRSNSVSGMFKDLLCQAQVDRMTHGAAHGLACLRIQPFPNLPNEPMRRHRVSLSIARSDSSTIHARGLATSGGQGNPHLFQLSVERSEERRGGKECVS